MMFAAFLKQKRTDTGLSQLALANALDVTPQAIQHWERGAARPDISKLPALSRALGVPSMVLAQKLLHDFEPDGNDGIPFLAIDRDGADQLIASAPNCYRLFSEISPLNPMAGSFYEAYGNVVHGLEAFTGEPLSPNNKSLLRTIILSLKENDLEIMRDAEHRAQVDAEHQEEKIPLPELLDDEDALIAKIQQIKQEIKGELPVVEFECSPDCDVLRFAQLEELRCERQLAAQNLYTAPPAYSSNLQRLRYCVFREMCVKRDKGCNVEDEERLYSILCSVLHDPIFSYVFFAKGSDAASIGLSLTGDEKLYVALNLTDKFILSHDAFNDFHAAGIDADDTEDCYTKCKYGMQLYEEMFKIRGIVSSAKDMSEIFYRLFMAWHCLPQYYKILADGEDCPILDDVCSAVGESGCPAVRFANNCIAYHLNPRNLTDDLTDGKDLLSALKDLDNVPKEELVICSSLDDSITYLLPPGADVPFITNVLIGFGCIQSL